LTADVSSKGLTIGFTSWVSLIPFTSEVEPVEVLDSFDKLGTVFIVVAVAAAAG